MSKNEKDARIEDLEEQIAKLEKLANHYMSKANQMENQLVLLQQQEPLNEAPENA